MANLSNSYIEEKAPWKLAKSGSEELKNIMYNLCEVIWVMSHYIYPFMPEIAAGIWSQLGQKRNVTGSDFLLTGKINLLCGKINKTGVLFPRIN